MARRRHDRATGRRMGDEPPQRNPPGEQRPRDSETEGGDQGGWLAPCVAALRGRRAELGRALLGRGLVVRLRVDAEGFDRCLVFVPNGDVVEVVPEGVADVDVEIRGSAPDVKAFLAGAVPLRVAVQQGVVVLRITEAETLHYSALRRLVAGLDKPSEGGV